VRTTFFTKEKHMKSRLMLLCAGLALFQSAAYGQDEQREQAQPSATRPLTQADLTAIDGKIQRLDAAVRILTDKIDALTPATPPQDDNLEAVEPTPGTQEARIKALEEKVRQLENAHHDMYALQGEQGTILNQLASRTETGGYHWRFDTNSQPARQEFDRALKSTVPPQADFVVVNRTARDECIYVNGVRHTVPAGSQHTVKVPPGTVTARLPHQQQPMALHVGFPNYYQSVDIKDRQATQPATQTYAEDYTEPVYWMTAY
jgi:hypothetical protein